MIEQSFTSSDGVRIAYRDYGLKDGTPVVLCHGIAVNSTQFIEDGAYFAGLGYRVLTPDLRGHGQSAAPASRRNNYAMARLARDQVEMLDHAGIERAHYIGNSLGGILGLTLLAEHAPRLRSFGTFGTSYKIAMPPVYVQPFVGLNFRVFKRLIVKFAAQLCSRDGDTQKRIEAMAMKANPSVIGALASAIVGYDGIASTIAASSTTPVLFIHCGEDLLMNWAMGSTRRKLRRAPQIEQVHLKKAGHCANLDATGALREALHAFWEKHR